MIKTGIVALIVLLIVVGAAAAKTKMRIAAVMCATILMGGTFTSSAQELSISKVNQGSNGLEIELTLSNSGAADILVVSPNPREGPKTQYFLTFDSNTKELQINRLLYSYPSYVLIEGGTP